MQALSFSKTGDLSALALVERPTPAPRDGEVLVEIKAAGLNPSDVKNVLGFFPAYTTLPRIPGRDFAGVVRQGPAELIGKRVFGTGLGLGFSQDGSHAQFLALPAGGCAEIPEKLSFAEAAACGVPYTTAWDGISRAKVGPGKNFLVIGGNGAVGRAAIALGRGLGANVVAAVRRPEQAAALEKLGYETLLLGAQQSLSEGVLAKFGAYADAIFDTTGAWLPAAIPAAAKHGAICVIAPPGMGKLHVDFPVLDFYRRGLTLLGVNSLLHGAIACAKMLEEFSGLFQSGALPPPPEPQSIRLADGLDAYKRVNDGYSGKIVFTQD
jgi:NADPH:quinone reductase-like Zn-dependent oxidoreductase